MTDKEKIFDYVVELEDELLSKVRVQLKEECTKKFGELGSQIVDKYYRQIDGEEDFDSDIAEDCNDCKEKARKLLRNVDFLKMCNEALTSELIDSIFEGYNVEAGVGCIAQDTEIAAANLLKTKCYDLGKDATDLLKLRILLEIARRYAKQ